MHWLANAALRAGIPGVKTANIPRNAAVATAWEQLADELRLSESALAEQVVPEPITPPRLLARVQARRRAGVS